MASGGTSIRAQPRIQKPLLRPLHALQRGGGDARAIGKARGEAGERRLVGGGEPHFPRECAYFGLRKTRLVERADDAEFPDRAAAGAVITIVVEVRSLEHCGQAIRARKGEESAEQFPLAVVAPVGRVFRESGDVQLVRVDDRMADALRVAERRRLVQFAFREGV